ncbi:MAG: hypothetical protein ACI31R_04580 [Bacilli bacterium]
MKINILCLYYDLMNLYGDTGNIKVIKYHLEELGIKYNIDYKSIEDKLDFTKYDLTLIGAGTEENRNLCLKHLLKYQKDINNYINNNKFFLATGNAISMFGKTLYNEKALNIFDFEVKMSNERISKEVILENDICSPIYGFFNHQDIITNQKDYLFNQEGIHYKNFYGTQTLGPILSRNPEFLEYFIKKLINSKDKNLKVKKLNTILNKKAYNEFIEFKKTKVFNSHKA